MSGLVLQENGRNSYPDFWATRGALREGYEIKSLAFARGKPARKDIDFNSTIPTGLKEGSPIFLAFFLYTGSGESPRDVHSHVLAHADFINADHELAERHANRAIRGFGSYGDGFIRDRKMYVMPHPLSVYPAGTGRASLILPTDWHISHPTLRHVAAVSRVITAERLTGYTIDLMNATATKMTEPDERRGVSRAFDVFERA